MCYDDINGLKSIGFIKKILRSYVWEKHEIYYWSEVYIVEKVLNGAASAAHADKKEYVMDMTEGNSLKLIMKFSIPLLIGNLFQQVYSVVDSVVVGRHLGANALGGVGSVGMISFLFFSLCSGMAAGIGVVISKYFGAKQDDMVKKAIANAVYVILAVGILMSVLGFCLTGPLIRLMNTPAETVPYAYTYMKITCAFTVAVAVYNGISSILRALGDSRTPLIFLIIASVINAVLDIILVVYLDMGVAGAAYATAFSQIVSGVGSIIYAVKTNSYFRLCREDFVVDHSIMKEDFRIGIPMAVQTSMISISCSLLQALINGYGPAVMAAYTATGKVEGIVFQPFSSLGLALSTFAGQNMGARRYDRIRKAVWQAECITIALSAVLFAAILLFRENIVSFFVTDEEVIQLGAKGMLISGSMYVALGTIYTLRGALNGMGDVVFSMINGFLEVGGRVVFALVLMYVLNMGFWGIWYTNIFTWVVIALTAAVRLIVYLRKVQRKSTMSITGDIKKLNPEG